MSRMDKNTLDYQAVMAHFGTRYKLAQALGLGISATYSWQKGYIPARYHERIAAMMAGQAAQDDAGATDSPSQPPHEGVL